jgi:uncharacterized membrane protein YuzA (DUF378 family)
MSEPENDYEIGELSDIYDTLKSDAKDIVSDLKGGVKMWREAAGANVAVAGFVLVLALTSINYGPGGLEGTLIRIAYLLVAAASVYYALVGFRKYFRLTRKYQGLFDRADKLE